MPREGPAYPITPEWQTWVRERIAQMKASGDLRSQNELAERVGIAKSSLSEALAKGAVQTTVMPQIHKALGWPAPLMTPPTYVLELVAAFTALPPMEQGRWLEQLRQAVARARTKR